MKDGLITAAHGASMRVDHERKVLTGKVRPIEVRDKRAQDQAPDAASIEASKKK